MSQVLVCSGLYRSGTTWTYNVACQILQLQRDFARFYAESIDEFFLENSTSARSFVIKCHHPTGDLIKLLNMLDAKFIVNIREPIHCVNSMVKQFGSDFNEALRQVVDSINYAETVISRGDCLILKYEEGFENGGDFIDKLSNYLEIKLSEEDERNIAQQYSKDSIRAHIDDLIKQGYFDGANPSVQSQERTLWHPHHVGPDADGNRDLILTNGQIYTIKIATKNFRSKWGYDDIFKAPPISEPCVIEFSNDGPGLRYLASGFAIPEEWGVWSSGSQSEIVIPLSSHIESLSVFFAFELCAVFNHSDDIEVKISVNGQVCFFERGREGIQKFHSIATHDIRSSISGIRILIEFKNMITLKEASISGEERELGISPKYIALQNIKVRP